MSFNVNKINEILVFLKESKKKLSSHPIYSNITTPEQLKTFMESHVFAVWDFMSLVKSLQLEFTSVHVPWTPPKNPLISRLINEIVLDEESDIDQQGNPTSHFELYIDAMNAFGANTEPIFQFIKHLESGSINDAINKSNLPLGVKDFIETTFKFIEKGSTEEIGAVFTFGREEIIPDMFVAMVKELNVDKIHSLEKFIYYLERHIELDGGTHSELCFQMLSIICKDDDKWIFAKEAAQKAIDARIKLWDNIYFQIKSIEVV